MDAGRWLVWRVPWDLLPYILAVRMYVCMYHIDRPALVRDYRDTLPQACLPVGRVGLTVVGAGPTAA